jgi:hypothetical protein
MTNEMLSSCIDACNVFVQKATHLSNLQRNVKFPNNPKEQGSVKRSSMDLTRLLAELRK